MSSYIVDRRKRELRQQIKDKVSALGSSQRAILSSQAQTKLEKLFAHCSCSHLAAYWSVSIEMATDGIINFFHRLGAHRYLPAVTGEGTMEFRHWQGEALSQDPMGIPSPPANADMLDPSRISLMLVPLRGFDMQGARLGTGGGYYDRFLSRTQNPPLLGLAFDEQLLDEVPTVATDVRLDAVLTPSCLHLFNTRLKSFIT